MNNKYTRSRTCNIYISSEPVNPAPQTYINLSFLDDEHEYVPQGSVHQTYSPARPAYRGTRARERALRIKIYRL